MRVSSSRVGVLLFLLVCLLVSIRADASELLEVLIVTAIVAVLLVFQFALMRVSSSRYGNGANWHIVEFQFALMRVSSSR